jgi:hypothetical protein
MTTPLKLAEDTYLALLKHPFDSWRIHNQKLYCDLRNFIADSTGESEQDVQEFYEAMAIRGVERATISDMSQSIYGFATDKTLG